MITDVSKLYRCSQHVPLSQLLRRVELNLKRRIMTSPLQSLFARRSSFHPPLRSDIPKALFRPRSHLVKYSGTQLFLCHLGREFSLQHPVDWMLESTKHTHLERLALHYHEFLESVSFEDGLRLILDWIQANPPWLPGYWLDRWNSYAISIRCVCWMQWLAEYRERLSEQDRNTIVGSLTEQVEFLKRNLETDICGNHLMKNIRCLMWASMFFDGAYAHRLSQLAENLLRWQLPIQFSEDGVHFELSPAYHCQVFGDLLECLAVASESVRLLLMSFLERAAQALVDLTHPDGRISLMSDGGLNMVYPPSEYLRVFRRQGGLPPSPRSHFAFPDAGYYGFRSRRSYLLFDCGPACAESLPAHGHADILAVEWDADGQRFIVDAGVYQYENGAARIRSRSVISHNTLQVGDRDQLELVGSFRTGRRSHGVCDINEPSRDGVILQGHHAGFSMTRQEVVHQRLINAEDRSLRIRDSVIGTASENAVGRLLLHDQCGIADMCDRRLELRRGDTRVQLTSTVPLKVVDAAWSPDFGQLIPTKCVEFSLGNVPCRSDVCLKIV